MSSSTCLMELAIKVVNEASSILRELFYQDSSRRIAGIGYSGDISFEADLVVEKHIVKRILSSGFKTMIVTEEEGLLSIDNPDYVALVDPLDGSLNFYTRIPFIAVSVVFYDYSQPYTDRAIAGALSNVFLHETYSFDEENIYVNGKPLENIDRDVKGVFSIYTDDSNLISRIKNILEKTTNTRFKIRTLGSASLESTYSVLGLIDMFISNTGRLRNLDIAFALAISEKLGLKSINLAGREVRFRTDRVEEIESIVLGKLSGIVRNMLL
ncbi:MAG: inositol monophosphatase family protein [Desulfurococcaceae archaeon]